MTKLATDAASRLWARGAAGAASAEDVGAATQRLSEELRAGLSRWVGTDGYQALLDRALGLAGVEHPVLRSVAWRASDATAAVAAAHAYGAKELASGVVALVANLTELLGRIVGEEMAVQLVERTGVPGPRGGASTDMRGVRDG